ncbi:MAG: alpha/beta hydrolase [Bacteroidota bacterium]
MRNTPKNETTLGRPSWFWLLTEAGRALTEWGVFIPYARFLAERNYGDQHPVLVLPGFMASDTSTAPLRKFLTQSGYEAYGWELGRNTAKIEFLEPLLEKLDSIYETHGEKISLIGWSLGGVFARQLAKAKPGLIRQVITLGSPFKGVKEANNVAWIHDLIAKRKKMDIDPALFTEMPLPAPVPTTAIYTKEDGIVPWQLCLEQEDDIHQNIQVRGSHFGLGVNPTVLEIIADRLLHNRENWVYFEETNVVKDFLFYPSL